MPLQFQNVDIPLAGLDQKTASLLRGNGTCDRVINGEYAKGGGRINKRRGYLFVNPNDVVGVPFTDDAVLTHLATLRDELVVFGYSHVMGLGSKESSLRGAEALVYRGPTNRGACRMTFVSQSRISQDYADET